MSFLVTAQIESVFRFDELEAVVHQRAEKALVAWGEMTLEEVKRRAPVGERPLSASGGKRAKRTKRLWETFRVGFAKAGFMQYRTIIVWTDDPNAIWQELGTRQRRLASYKPQTHKVNERKVGDPLDRDAGNVGVTPKYFMRAALRATYAKGVALVLAELRGINDHSIPSIGHVGRDSYPAFVDTTSIHNPAKRPGARPNPLQG